MPEKAQPRRPRAPREMPGVAFCNRMLAVLLELTSAISVQMNADESFTYTIADGVTKESIDEEQLLSAIITEGFPMTSDRMVRLLALADERIGHNVYFFCCGVMYYPELLTRAMIERAYELETKYFERHGCTKGLEGLAYVVSSCRYDLVPTDRATEYCLLSMQYSDRHGNDGGGDGLKPI